ncbi:TRAP transporter substrate-binding protein [Acuticoccus sp.]|uniref:TRAP transporter substrate-binding protein n=1 Tax=Acuticoccus sp. TaxID=1904378 RepID=UPI003B5236E2
MTTPVTNGDLQRCDTIRSWHAPLARVRHGAIASMGALALAGAPSSSQAQEIELTFAGPYPDALFHVQNIRQFIEDIETSSDGRIKISFYPAQSLFNHSEAMQAVRTGQVDMAELQLTQFANQEELYNVEALPYLAKSFEEAMTLWDIALPAITERLRQDRIMPLYTVPWPPQAFYANKELKAATDMEGLKFRVYNPIGARMAEQMGAEPVLVGGGEVPQAFSTGMIDSMITSSAFGASASAWDYVDVFNDVQAWFGYDQIVMNIRSFERLPEDLQHVVTDAAARAAERGLQMSEDAHVSEMKTLEDNGMAVVSGHPAFVAAAQEATKVIIEDWIEAVGPTGEAIVSEFRERTAE